MAHEEQMQWLQKVKNLMPKHFLYKDVLEFGSRNINGTVRDLFMHCTHRGIDVTPGDCVDYISLCHEYKGDPADVVVSTEMLEHDPYWQWSLKNMVKLLRPNGLLLITCATTGRAEHGSDNTDGLDYGPKIDGKSWYFNFAPHRLLWAIEDHLESILMEYDSIRGDLYLAGTRKCD